MREMKDGLYQIIRLLLSKNKTHRIRRATLYLTVVNEQGDPSAITFENEITMHPYDCAADAFD